MKSLKNILEVSILTVSEANTKQDDEFIRQFENLKTLMLDKKSYFDRYNNKSSYMLEIEHIDTLFDYFNVNYKNSTSIIVDIKKYDVDMNIYDYEWNFRFDFYSNDKCIKSIEKVFYTKQMMFSEFLETKIEPLVKDFKTFEKFVKNN